MQSVSEQVRAPDITTVTAIRKRFREPRHQGLQQHGSRRLERLLVGPHLADDFHAGVLTGGLNGDHAPAGSKRRRQRRQHGAHLDVHRVTRTVGLRGDNQIVTQIAAALARNDRVQHEFLIAPVEHQHRRLLVERIAGLLAGAHLPPVLQQRPQRVDLGFELMGRAAIEGHLAPMERRLLLLGVRAQARRLGVMHVGHDDHHVRMLGETVRQLLQGQAQILDADLLAHHHKGHIGKRLVQPPEGTCQHGAVAGPRVEQMQRRRLRHHVGNFRTHLLRHGPLLTAGGDEHQVLLAVIEEAKRPFRRVRPVTHDSPLR